MIGRLRSHLGSLLTALNYLGSILLAYALANPAVATELVAMLPPTLRPYAPVLAIGWFAIVQYAKMKALAKANANVS
jgi:hypothetical protein